VGTLSHPSIHPEVLLVLRSLATSVLLLSLVGSAGAAVRRPPTEGVELAIDDGKAVPALDRVSVKALALQYQPSLAAARASVREAEATFAGARLYPNPELSVEAEELTRDFDIGPGLLMTTINQSILTGGKRRWHMRAAKAGVTRVVMQYEQSALEVVRDATKAYYELIAANRKLTACRELARIAAEFHARVRTRVEGGVARPIEGDRALVLSAQAAVDLRRILADQIAARQALATAIGVPLTRITTEPAGRLEHGGRLPDVASLQSKALAQSPALKIPLFEEQVARGELGLARAARIPDVTVGLSVQHQSSADASHDLRGFQLTVPLPVINHGQADRARARAQISGAQSRQLLARQTLENRLIAAYQTARRAHDQIESYLHDILPAARRAVATSLEGYEAGEFSYLDVLDAQRSLTASNQTYFDVLLEYQKARADLEEIVAAEVPELPEHDEVHEEPR
jgi:cobalt-zinc-cadmium efflux system outer membrane protein